MTRGGGMMKFKIYYVLIFISTFSFHACSTTNDDESEDGATLYDRLGGKSAVTAVVVDFTSRVAANDEINQFFANTDIAKFKRLLSEHLCLVTGGGCRYSGRDMYTIHKGMGISTADFNSLVGNLVSTLDSFGVPEQEKGELLETLGNLSGVIVEKE